MHAAFVDIENEFHEVEQEVKHLATALARRGSEIRTLEEQSAWELAHVLASATEKIYTGCERVMARIAQDVDGSRVGHTEGWHQTLLRRVSNPYPGVRGAVISHDCHVTLDRLRAFRHRERNTYGLDLDLDIVVQRAAEAITAVERFHEEVKAFFSRPTGNATGHIQEPNL